MADKKNILIPPQGGVWRELMLRIKLVFRLMGDSRVNAIVKLLPLAGLLYWILPLPFDNMIPVIDDATVVFLSTYLFIELCPPEVVKEYAGQLSSNIDAVNQAGSDDIIEGEVIDDEGK